jgi:hypothetical protein
MINGKRHVLLPGEHLVVPPGLYRTFGNSTAEVGHAIAAFRPAMNIHQLFVEFFEAFRTSRGLKRQVGSQRCYTATPTHQVPQADAATRCCSGLVTDAQQTALTCLPHGGRWAKSSHVSPLAISRMRPRVKPVAVRRLPCKPTGLRALGLCQMRNPVGPYAAISDGRDPNCRCFAAPRLGGCWQSDQGERHAGLAVLRVSHVLRTSGLCHCWRTSQERRFGRRAAGVLGALRSEWVWRCIGQQPR